MYSFPTNKKPVPDNARFRVWMKARYEFIHYSNAASCKDAIVEAHAAFPEAALVDVEHIKRLEVA